MSENICKFLPLGEDHGALHIVNLVLETRCPTSASLYRLPTYRLHYVAEGSGLLHTPQSAEPLQPGDLYFVPPASPFAIENTNDIKYMYISFTGIRANLVADQLKTGQYGSVFRGFPSLLPLWESAFTVPNALSNMRCESILLYTFSEIQKKFAEAPSMHSSANAAESIKRYIDGNFADCELCLDMIGSALSYHPKYVSTVFKGEFKIGVAEYLMMVRIQHACALMEQGFTSMKTIASMCGFKDSLYFSKVFKARMGITPKEHLKQID